MQQEAIWCRSSFCLWLLGVLTWKCLGRQVVREADGYQGHLVSPELGLRRMVDETLGLVIDPVATCVRRVHQVLIDAARSVPQHTPSPLKPSLTVPG